MALSPLGCSRFADLSIVPCCQCLRRVSALRFGTFLFSRLLGLRKLLQLLCVLGHYLGAHFQDPRFSVPSGLLL